MDANPAPMEPTDKRTNTFEHCELGGLPVSAQIFRADNGARVSLKTLLQSGERPLVWSLDKLMRFVARPMDDVLPVDRAKIAQFRLASGRSIDIATEARLLTIDGWRQLRTLAVGDRIAIPRWIPAPKNATTMAEAEITLLGHMIGDGSFVKRQPIRYASVDEENLAAVTTAATHFGITAIRDDYEAARVTTLRLPAPYRLTHGKRNPIAAWLDELGLFGLRSYEKFVPDAIFALPTDMVVIFLRHLWATDGSARWDETGRQGRIYYTSTSLRLIHDVADLLLRLGVHGRIRLVPKAGYRDCWHLTIDGADNQITFLEDIGVHGARGVTGEACLAQLDTMTSNPNVDTVPKEIWNRVRALLTEKNMTHRQFQTAMGTKFCGSTMWKHSPSHQRLARAAYVLDAPELMMHCTSDVFWDRITEITSLGEQEVFSISGPENLVAQGICVQA
ncbi:LAGLIDADG family homing endonuclease [Nocardia sp. NPDC020380]|uniref:LAGLIDADG family homing endonuclease n=1 Tax=Nocardia sp. NPDC020380 TaxID=3364309 RepID=UPI00379D6CD8